MEYITASPMEEGLVRSVIIVMWSLFSKGKLRIPNNPGFDLAKRRLARYTEVSAEILRL